MRVPLPLAVLPVALPLVALLPRSSGAATILVPQDEPTIQAGLDAAASGDTVLVACGTYHEPDLQLASGVVLRSETGVPGCVVVDPQGAGRAVFASGLPVGTLVEGITFTGGYNDEGQDFDRLLPGPEDRSVMLAPAERDYGGGGGGYLILSYLTFRDCEFAGNEARVNGGGIRCEGGAPVFERCVFRDNLAGNQGGGLYVGEGTDLVLTDCEILDNDAEHGAGIYAGRPDAVTCTGCRFEGNAATGSAGGFHASLCDPVLDGCTFSGNSAGFRGGAMALFDGTATITSTTIALNDAPAASGILAHTGTVNASETIIALQTGSEPVQCVSGGTVQLTCCDVWGNAVGDWSGCLAGQDGTAGNFSADPLFCSWATGALSLTSVSPCLPSGNSCGVLIGSTSDIGCAGTVTALLDTSPGGLEVLLEGHPLTAPYTVHWVADSTYTLGTTSPQLPAPDVQHTFLSWSDDGAIVHPVTAPDTASSFIASFTTEYLLTTTASAGGTVVPATPAFHPEGDSVSVEAIPSTGYEFAGWTGTGSGSYSGSDNPATVTMDGPITQHAAFQLVLHTVTMAADSGGTVSPAAGDHSYVEGTVVPISASPDSGWKFTDWTGTGSGSYTGTANPSQITVNGPITQTAHFAPLQRYALTMVADSGGTVTPPTGDYIEGTMVTITATPSSGYVFGGWTGTGTGSYTGSSNPATVTMDGPITQTAHFTPLYPLTMAADSGGVVTPTGGTYPAGTVVTIQGFALANHAFSSWTGSGPGSYTGPDNPATVTMNGPVMQTAHFTTPATFPLTMTVGSGAGTLLPGSGDFPNGGPVQITAVADSAYTFSGWIGSGFGSYNGTGNPATITMDGPVTETAYFVPTPVVTLTMTANPGGVVLPGTGSYLQGTAVTITAIPDSGSSFVSWTGSGPGSYSGPDSSVTITLDGDVTEVASFEYEVAVTVTTAPAGFRIGVDGTDYVSPRTFLWLNTSQHSVDVDSLVPGAAGERDRFTQWSDGTATAARTIDVPDLPITHTAAYTPEYLLDFQDPPEGTSLPGDGWYAPGDSVVIEALANPGFLFTQWTGQGSGSYTGTANPATVTMDEPLVQTPAFGAYGYEFSISASATDPFVNTRAPTGGPTNIYLWMTCTDVGIAAFEADVSSSVPYTAFTPAPGVLNAGGATNLLLAFTGCPGVGAPYLVGTLAIDDTGGEVCLVPSAANGRIGAVNCDVPQFIVDPVRVNGFSSSGQPPCYVAGTPCLSPVARSAGEAPPESPDLSESPGFTDSFLGAFPNPFVGRTLLRFSVARSGPARLAVYDVTGRRVRTVLDRSVAAGVHDVEWDGRAEDGTRSPAGVYFARLEAGGRDRTKKIVLLGRSR